MTHRASGSASGHSEPEVWECLQVLSAHGGQVPADGLQRRHRGCHRWQPVHRRCCGAQQAGLTILAASPFTRLPTKCQDGIEPGFMKVLTRVQVGTPAAANSVARLEGTNPDNFEAGKEVVVAFEARDAFGNTVSAGRSSCDLGLRQLALSAHYLTGPLLAVRHTTTPLALLLLRHQSQCLLLDLPNECRCTAWPVRRWPWRRWAHSPRPLPRCRGRQPSAAPFSPPPAPTCYTCASAGSQRPGGHERCMLQRLPQKQAGDSYMP